MIEDVRTVPGNRIDASHSTGGLTPSPRRQENPTAGKADHPRGPPISKGGGGEGGWGGVGGGATEGLNANEEVLTGQSSLYISISDFRVGLSIEKKEIVTC